jgi:toxin ParE1/3/4
VSGKPAIPRDRASRDAEEAFDRCLAEAGARVALGFADALQRALRHISRHPASGSSRYASELDLPGLRFWPLKRYPFLVFYVERDDHVDIWRILHGERDIPAWMREPE